MRKGSGEAREKLVAVAVRQIRATGYAGTSVDTICQHAGVSRGAFFHHFDSKEALAAAAAEAFQAHARHLFESAEYRELADPVDRLLGYVDLRLAMISGEFPEFTCLLGTIVQEAYIAHPELVESCGEQMWEHMEAFDADIAEAVARSAPGSDFTAMSLSQHIQAVIQGGFVLAKASGDPNVAIDCLKHLRRYLELLFGRGPAHRGGQDD